MKRVLSLAGTGLILLFIIFFSSASAATSTKKPAVSFQQPKLNGPSSSLGHTGVVAKIQSASVAKDGTITARVAIKDADGNSLDRLGKTTAGAVAISFIAAYIPAGKTQYVSYTIRPLAATINTNPTQNQAGTDAGGVFTQNAIGDYTYVFGTKAPATYDASVTHTIGVTAVRDLSEYGTFDEWAETSNDTFNFVPNGSAVKVTRSLATTDACNGCHNPLIGHGGQRLTVEVCILCHQPQTINPDTQLSMDMPVLIHKIHSGSSLPSVKAGTPYRVWHRGAWSDFSSVVFPKDVRNCTTCHISSAGQPDAWKTNPTSAACGACHDDVNFATGQNHPIPVFDDTQCKQCHTPQASQDFDASIPGAHVIPSYSNSVPGIIAKILNVTGTSPGTAPTVTFSLTDKSNNPILDLSKLSSIRVVLGGPNSDYNTGPGGIRVSETPALTSKDGTYTYTMTNKVPAAATGSYTVSLEAAATTTLLAGTTKQTTATYAAIPVRSYFSVDSSPVTPRRQVVATEKCASCHGDLTFVHGGTRSDVKECVVCHNPALSDGTSGQSVNFATQIHSIHRGENLANPYVLGTTNYQEVRFPGDLRACTTCHMDGTYLVENFGGTTQVASPGGFTKTTGPIAAACQGCHDDKATASHALANTTALGESCAACHSAGEAFSVDRVHQRVF